MKEILARLKILLTGQVSWVNSDTGELEPERVSFGEAWAIAGVHSYQWKWVRRYGKRSCGCLINPLTRRYVLYSGDCEKHCSWLKDKTD